MKKLLLLLSLSVATAFAAPVDSASMAAHQAKIDAAVTARDYDAWKAEHDAFSQGKGGAKVTRENFETFAKMREAQAAGRTEEAQTLRTELGMGQGQGKGQGMKGAGQGKGQCAKAGQASAGCAKGQGMKGAGQGKGGAGCRRTAP